MKKSLLLLSSIFILASVPIIQAQDSDVEEQITQLQNEIKERQDSIRELRDSQHKGDTIEFEHEGLKFSLQLETEPYDGEKNYFEDTYVVLHINVENTTDSAIAFYPSNFNMYLAEMHQGKVSRSESMDDQAIPGNTTVEGKVYFNVTQAVSNDKDLVIRYEPSDTIFVGESVFEFKVNDYKFINSDTESVEEEEEVTFTPVEDTTETAMNYEETTNYVEPLDYPENVDEGTYEVTEEAIFYQVDGVQYIETDVYKGPLINPQGPEVPYDELTD